jgi:hypothetical protein
MMNKRRKFLFDSKRLHLSQQAGHSGIYTNPSYTGIISRRVTDQGQPPAKRENLSEK